MRHWFYLPLLVALSLPSGAFAQGGNGSLRGYIKDQQGAVLPGVAVTATSPALLSSVTSVTDKEGYYRLLNLPPGTYTILAELSGFSASKREGILLRAGINFEVDINMVIGALQETVTVKGESPMLEVSRPSNVLNIEGDFQNQVPIQPRRNWSDFVELTPGVIARPFDDNSGRTVVYGHGAELFANVIQIEGMNAANYQDAQVAYVSMSTDTMQDVQVKSAGVDASEPMGVGLVINLVTKSGGNQFSGGAVYTLQPLGWNGNNPEQGGGKFGGTPTIQAVHQLDTSLGGPIRRDTIWFFASYRRANTDNGISRTPRQVELLQGFKPGFTPFNNAATSNQPYVKLTARLSAHHQLNAYYQHDRATLQADQALNYEPFIVFVNGGSLYGGKLTSTWGNHVTTQFTGSYNNKGGADQNTFNNLPGKGPQIDINQSAFLSGGRLVGTGALVRGGNVQSLSLQPASMLIFRGDLTYFKEGWKGSHEFQTGIYAAPRLRTAQTTNYVNGGFVYEERSLVDPNNIGGGTVPFHRRYVSPDSIQTLDARDRDVGTYLQDSWKPGSRLTANLGVRVDFVKRYDGIFNIDRMKSVEVGPRFGVSYLVTNDARTVLRGSVGRVHEAVNGRDASTSTSAGGGRVQTVDDYYNPDGSLKGEFVTPALSPTLAGYAFNSNLHQPYVNEFVLGFRKQFPGQFAVDVAGIHRRFTDRYAFVDVNGIYPAAPGAPFIGFGKVDPNRGILNQLTNNTWDKLIYTALEITATKNLANNYQFLVGINRQWQHLSGTWNPTDPAGFIQPSAYPNDKLIWPSRGGTDQNSYALGLNSGYGPMWQKYSIRFGATYLAPAGFALSANFTDQAGPWTGFILTKLPDNSPDVLKYGPPTFTLPNGTVVSNPLATTVRIRYPTRGDGQVLAPSVKVLNFKIGKRLKLGGHREFELAANVFNVLNANNHWIWDYANATQDFNPGYLTMLSRQAARAAQATFMFRF